MSEMNELNKKLAEWAGFHYQEEDGYHYRGWIYADSLNQSRRYISELNFTQSLDACFKWLVPKIDKTHHLTIELNWNRFTTELYLLDGFGSGKYVGEAETPALALCLAIEKLIDGECKHNWVRAENEVIKSGEICTKCNAIRR